MARARMQNLQAILARRGRKQAWLVTAMHVSHVTVSRWVSGQRNPERSIALRIATLLDVEIDELYGDAPIMSDDERELIRLYRAAHPDARASIIDIVRISAGIHKRPAAPEEE